MQKGADHHVFQHRHPPERDGLRTLLFWHSGLKQITTNVRPVLWPEDFRGLVFRRMQSSTIARYLELLGARTVPAPFNQTFPRLPRPRERRLLAPPSAGRSGDPPEGSRGSRCL
ncbi:MAG: hypothetical protein KM312_06230 [Hydrogenibacillus schlegelii]|uniref:Uncharacterized protein n=1 Tax=Hydrogenibacillus schlegelii TaxID=1484 RepID=A0A947CYL8_HYDSH|nr:hypothetical protein [Hydrogenibacillus schlegelii]